MPDLKALNDIHAVHLTAVLRLSSSLHICIQERLHCVYIRDKCKKNCGLDELTANDTLKLQILHQHIV